MPAIRYNLGSRSLGVVQSAARGFAPNPQNAADVFHVIVRSTSQSRYRDADSFNPRRTLSMNGDEASPSSSAVTVGDENCSNMSAAFAALRVTPPLAA